MKWEYCILNVSPEYDNRTKQVYSVSTLVYTGPYTVTLLAGQNLPIAQVTHLGQQGWELVSVTTIPMSIGNVATWQTSYYMKRRTE